MLRGTDAEREVEKAKDQVAEDAKALLTAETKYADFLKRKAQSAGAVSCSPLMALVKAVVLQRRGAFGLVAA